MKRLLVLVLVGCGGCPTPQPPKPTDLSVYQALVDAGCLAESDGGVADIAAEHALGDKQPAWLSCMYEVRGNVASCAVPCKK